MLAIDTNLSPNYSKPLEWHTIHRTKILSSNLVLHRNRLNPLHCSINLFVDDICKFYFRFPKHNAKECNDTAYLRLTAKSCCYCTGPGLSKAPSLIFSLYEYLKAAPSTLFLLFSKLLFSRHLIGSYISLQPDAFPYSWCYYNFALETERKFWDS